MQHNSNTDNDERRQIRGIQMKMNENYLFLHSEFVVDSGLHTIKNTLWYSTIIIIIMCFNRMILALILNLKSEIWNPNKIEMFKSILFVDFLKDWIILKGKKHSQSSHEVLMGFLLWLFCVFVWNKHYQDLSLCDFVCFLAIIIFLSVFSFDNLFFSQTFALQSLAFRSIWNDKLMGISNIVDATAVTFGLSV